MVLATHDFGRHVAGCAGGVLGVVFSPDTCDAEISNAQVPVTLDDQVLWLDVAMNDVFVMYVLQTRDKTGNEKAGGFFVKLAVAADVVAQITA